MLPHLARFVKGFFEIMKKVLKINKTGKQECASEKAAARESAAAKKKNIISACGTVRKAHWRSILLPG